MKPKLMIDVDFGDGARGLIPAPGDDEHDGLNWMLRYMEPSETLRLSAAACLDNFEYLITSCTKEDAWRRLKLMRAAYLAARENQSTSG